MTTKPYHISDILSVSTGSLVSNRHMEGVYDIMSFMTGEPLMTHQLIRAFAPCKAGLVRQHPWLADVEAPTFADPKDVAPWVAEMCEQHGAEHQVSPLAEGEYEARNPITELADIIGPKKVIVAALPSEDE